MEKWLFDIRSRTFFLLALAFLILAYLAYAKVTVTADGNFENYMQKISGNTTLDLLMQSFTELGWVLYPIFVAIVLFIIKKTRRLGLTLLLALLVGTMSAAYMTCYIGYEKPDLQFMGAHLPFKSGTDVSVPCAIKGTFPAGYTVRATIFAFVISYALSGRFPRGCYLVWLYPIAISISRLYLLQEYPTTVIAGVIYGILIADIVGKILKIELIFDKSKAQ
ncbi:MAG: phosphatase PAP2 family protein [Nitrosotalea sp.]